jgi:hypothetical protein
MSKINARSPYYVRFKVPNLTQVDMELYIYGGVQTTSRKNLFQLTSFAISYNVTFDISEIVRDYLLQTFDGDYLTPNVWVDYRTNSYIQGVAQGFTSFTQLTGFDGYGYFEDGYNPQNDDLVLQTNRTILKLADTPAVFPLYVNQNSTIAFLLNGEVVKSFTGTVSPFSGSQIKYVTNGVNGADMFEDRVIQDGGTFESNVCLTAFEDEFALLAVDEIRVSDADGNLTTIKVQDIEECKYQPYKLTFVNKYGALQSIWFFKRTNEVLTTKTEKFKRNIVVEGTYDTSRHQQKILTKNGNEKLTLNTGFYPEEYNDVFKQMQLSEDCWIEINSQTLPINVSSSSLNYKTHLNDKLINYTIEVEFAFDAINNIR